MNEEARELEKDLANGYRELYVGLALERVWLSERTGLFVSVMIIIWMLLEGMYALLTISIILCFFWFSSRFFREAFYIATEVAAHEELKRRGILDEE